MGMTKKKQRTANLQLVKAANLSLVFHLINQYGQTSRAEVAHITGLSPTTVSSLVDELIDNEMVVECGAGESTTSGRKPVLIEVNPSGGYVAGIELVADGFWLELYDLCGVCVDSRHKEVKDWNVLGNDLVSAIEKNMSRLKIPANKLLGICVGVPALLDKDARRVVESSVIPIDETNDFFKTLQSKFRRIPVKMGVESCFCAYSEKCESRRELHNLLYININEGIGGGMIIDDKIYTGSSGYAGELGHITVELDGNPCACGNNGCLETVASVPAIKKNFTDAMNRGEETTVKPHKDGTIPFHRIAHAFEKNDPLAIRIVDQACEYIAIGISNVISIMNPEAVIVGGRITELGQGFLDLLCQKLKTRVNKAVLTRTMVTYSCSKKNAVTNGCAKYLLAQIFDVNEFLVQ